ncbi:S9 family peptidase [Marinobacterium weihaiense]|uniref:Prolyl oligopeptidase family serine peptidase n=1 Tax=Marinobacterium weihaiense TaxID=2851016 RepID=A0ABS6M712_9GAMM|nr:prolyl oligopeptidase family serine peptidase [Marinobacterium weihaiense]MBV0932086.1 prolyl oligopeptidase family serine peptidase [Marinobacterium weihaiense]
MNVTPVYSPAAEPLSAEAAVAAIHDYSGLRFHQGQLLGVSFDAASGRNRLCRFVEGTAVSLLPERFSVRSRVHEYGGGAWCLAGDRACFVNDKDQQIWQLDVTLGGMNAQGLRAGGWACEPLRLTRAEQTRFADLQFDADRARLIAISETHPAAGEAINRLVSIALSGASQGQAITLAEGADFYSSPALSPDGRQLAWIEWDHPHQPWLDTRLMLAQLDEQGRVQQVRRLHIIAGADGAIAWAQPRFAPDGRLHAVADADNWWRLHVLAGTDMQPLPGEPPAATEFTTAPWQFGLSTYGWTPRGELIAIGQCEGYSRLWRHHGTTWLPFELGVMPSRLHALVCADEQLACVAEFGDRLPGLLHVDTGLAADDLHQCRLLHGGTRPDFAVSLPLSQSANLPDSEGRVPYFLYRPQGAPADQRLPLVIWTHGGPTASTAPVFRPAIQFWTQRGFMIADVNYRGSTGYGRDYRLALAGRWGITDVDDVQAVARSLIDQGLADPRAVFIRGNSAGGFTTLNALCHSELFSGGASLYGVSDPARLNALTHKFESRYLYWLIGDPECDAARYRQRAPLQQAHRIRVPVIFFQGEQDRVVLPEQTRAMAAALSAKGVPVETHYFAEEAHGFRQPANQAAVLKRELAFYRHIIAMA